MVRGVEWSETLEDGLRGKKKSSCLTETCGDPYSLALSSSISSAVIKGRFEVSSFCLGCCACDCGKVNVVI